MCWNITLVILWIPTCISCKVFVSPLPRDLADLKARIIAAVKNIHALMLTRVCVCGKNLNIVSLRAVSPVVHKSIRYLVVIKKNFFDFPVAVNNSIKVGPLVFLL